MIKSEEWSIKIGYRLNSIVGKADSITPLFTLHSSHFERGL